VGKQISKMWIVDLEDESRIHALLEKALKSWKVGFVLGAKSAGKGSWELTRAKEQTGSILEFSVKPAPGVGLVVAVVATSFKWSLVHPFHGAISNIEKALTSEGAKPWTGDFGSLSAARSTAPAPMPVSSQVREKAPVPFWNDSPIDTDLRRLLAKFDDSTVIRGIELILSRQGRLAYVPLSSACQEICSGEPRL
jgi:hypothetical protein